MSYWKRVDERLIKRGMLIMDLDFVRSYRDEYQRFGLRNKVERFFRYLKERTIVFPP
jgi:hypothetical protein